MQDAHMLSVLIPLKDEEANIGPLYERLCEALGETSWEVIFVDDGSRDRTFRLLSDLASRDQRVRVVRLRRNFGQTAALQAAIDHSQGDVLVTMDGDLQNDPADIPALLARLEEGFDVVLGLRANRKDGWLLRKLPSHVANWLIRRVTGVPFRDFGCTLRAMRRDVAESLPLYGEMHRFVPALAQFDGARITQIPVRHHPRLAGRTKYGLSRTVRVLLDLLTVQFLNRYLTRPMHLFGAVGLLLMLAGFVTLGLALGMRWAWNMHLVRNPLLLLSVMLELCGVQLLSTGLLGELLARTYFESQNKTPYTVRETRNLETCHPAVATATVARLRQAVISPEPAAHHLCANAAWSSEDHAASLPTATISSPR
jgi:glycosyltransferase involved in cell wall biosynthesis